MSSRPFSDGSRLSTDDKRLEWRRTAQDRAEAPGDEDRRNGHSSGASHLNGQQKAQQSGRGFFPSLPLLPLSLVMVCIGSLLTGLLLFMTSPSASDFPPPSQSMPPPPPTTFTVFELPPAAELPDMLEPPLDADPVVAADNDDAPADAAAAPLTDAVGLQWCSLSNPQLLTESQLRLMRDGELQLLPPDGHSSFAQWVWWTQWMRRRGLQSAMRTDAQMQCPEFARDMLCAALACRAAHDDVSTAHRDCMLSFAASMQFNPNEARIVELLPSASVASVPPPAEPASAAELRIALCVLVSDKSIKGRSLGAELVPAVVSAVAQHPQISVVLHVDAKSSAQLHSAMAALVQQFPRNVRVVQPPWSVTWQGVNMVTAVVHAMAIAVQEFNPHAFMVLSESSVPVARMQEMVDWCWLRQCWRLSFFDLWRRDAGSINTRGHIPIHDCDFCCSPWFNVSGLAKDALQANRTLLHSILTSELDLWHRVRALSDAFELTDQRQLGQRLRRASQWMLLASPFVRWMLQSERSASLLQYLHHGWNTPDESFFSTLVMLSPHSADIRQYPVMFMNRSNSRTFGARELPNARERGALFGRKVTWQPLVQLWSSWYQQLEAEAAAASQQLQGAFLTVQPTSID